MQHQRHYWLIPGIGSFRAKLLGASIGLIAGLLLAGIVIPSKLIAAPLTAIAGAMAAVVIEYRLHQIHSAPLLALRGALIGAAAGLLAGALVGLAAALAVGAYFVMRGYSVTGAFGLPVETAVVTGIAGLVTGFWLGVSIKRDAD